MRYSTRITLAATLALALALPVMAQAQGTTYRVTITNLSQSQVFSPPVVAAHRVGASVFTAGRSADTALRLLAEDGDPSALAQRLEADDRVGDVAVSSGPLMPGQSLTLSIQSRVPFFRLSAVGMLVTTNDAFFGLENHPLPTGPWFQQVLVPAYDAGTEANNEDCAFIPGPPCGNAGVRDTDGAEGFISVHPGVYGQGDLDPATFDWRNPVAKVTVIRVTGDG